MACGARRRHGESAAARILGARWNRIQSLYTISLHWSIVMSCSFYHTKHTNVDSAIVVHRNIRYVVINGIIIIRIDYIYSSFHTNSLMNSIPPVSVHTCISPKAPSVFIWSWNSQPSFIWRQKIPRGMPMQIRGHPAHTTTLCAQPGGNICNPFGGTLSIEPCSWMLCPQDCYEMKPAGRSCNCISYRESWQSARLKL